MRTDDLPASKNIEDRRDGGPKYYKPPKTLMEQEGDVPEPKSPLAKQAGIGDI